MSWTIRPIAPEEADCIVPLLLQLHALHAEARPAHHNPTPDPDEALAFLRGWLGEEETTALVAFAPDGTALGYLLVGIETRGPTLLRPAQRRGMLHHIAVDQGARRLGIGSALIDAMKAHLRTHGVTRVVAIYATFNTASAALMRKAGLAPFNVIAEGEV
jgi:ribosomal protein S18 acetylase RimI-like enzyme